MSIIHPATMFLQQTWGQARGQVGRWTPQQKSPVSSLILFACIVPTLAPAEGRSSEQFSAGDDLTTYGYSDAEEVF